VNIFTKLVTVVASVGLLQACVIEQPIAPSQMKATENSVFTDDGRFFVIGENSQRESWIFEVVRNGDDSYSQIEYVRGTLEGTLDGELGGEALGEACVFGGLAVQGNTLYAACNHIALYQVNTELGSEQVKSGRFTAENFIPKDEGGSFNPNLFFANGMAVDDSGHVYLSNSFATNLFDPTAITQVKITSNASTAELEFTHQPWIKVGDYALEFFPNGIQIEDDILYYASLNEIRKVKINENGSAGDMNLHYRGLMTDDFEIFDGWVALASVSLPGTIKILPPGRFDQRVGSVKTIPLAFIPSSVRYQADRADGENVFAAGSLVVTSFFSGGIYTIND